MINKYETGVFIKNANSKINGSLSFFPKKFYTF